MLKTMRVFQRVGILTGVLLLASMSLTCNVWLKRPPFTTVEPKKADFVGTWIPNAATLKMMQGKGGYASAVKTSLVLRSDATFELSNMPDWWSSPSSESHGKFEQYSGKWVISQQDSSPFWHLRLDSAEAVRIVALFRQNPPYQIAFGIGDPDNDEWIIFEKQ